LEADALAAYSTFTSSSRSSSLFTDLGLIYEVTSNPPSVGTFQTPFGGLTGNGIDPEIDLSSDGTLAIMSTAQFVGRPASFASRPPETSIFRKDNSGTWNTEQVVTIDSVDPNVTLEAIAIEGDYAFIQAEVRQDNFIYKYDGTTWKYLQNTEAEKGDIIGDQFYGNDIYGNRVVKYDLIRGTWVKDALNFYKVGNGELIRAVETDPSQIVVGTVKSLPNLATSGKVYVFDSTPVAQQLTLRITNNSSFLTDLDWSGLPSNVVGQYVLNIKRSTGDREAITFPSSTTTYTDTVVDFGIVNTYFVDAFTTDILDLVESNFVRDTLPAIIQPLQLNYVCYDAASDSLTWSVSNPNPKDHPFIYAQWWNAQRDTLYAQAGGTVTFKTKNNPQNPGTFGDDNITGIWWIDQTLTPGQPNDIVFNIPLSQSCAGLRMANTSPAQKAGSIFEGTLGNYLKVNVEAQDLLTGQVQIAPNPVSERLTIRGLQLEGEGNVQITNTLGQVIFEQSVELQKEISLNLQALPVGTYIMTLKTPVGNVSEKILKE